MRSLVPLALVALLSAPIVGAAQEAAGAKDTKAKLAEVRFADGSVVRMTMLQDQLDVMTRYGKLSVPLADIRRIEFGLHMPTGLSEQISTSIKLLGIPTPVAPGAGTTINGDQATIEWTQVGGETGYTLPRDDEARLVDALVTLMRERDLAARMGAAGAARWRTEFSFSAFERRLTAALGDFLG